MIDWCAILIFYSSLILQRSIWINVLCNFIVWAHISNNCISLRVYHNVMKYGSEKRKKKEKDRRNPFVNLRHSKERDYLEKIWNATQFYTRISVCLLFKIAQILNCYTNILKYYVVLWNYCVLLKVKLYPSMRLVNFETCTYLFTDRFSVPIW